MAGDTEKRIRVKTILDTSGFNSSIKGVNAELKNAQSQLKMASSGIQSFGRDSEKLKSVQEALSKQVELHSKKVDIYSKSVEKTKGKLEENIRARDKLKSSLDSANKKYEDAIKTYGKESEQAKKAKEEVDRLTKEHKKSEKAVESNAKKIQQYDTNLNKAQTQMNKAQGELSKLNKELAEGNNKWLQHSKALKESGKNWKSVGNKVGSVGNSFLKLGAPIAAVGVASAKVGMDFESEMSKVQAISGSTGNDFLALKSKAEEMGSKTKFSATESAQGLEYMAMAGWKTEDMLDGLPPVLDLAVASGGELGETSDIVTDALTAFGLKAKDAGEFSDVLAAASTNANTNVQMMGSTFQYAAPVAGSLGYSVQDTAISIGLMASAGIKADKAGTALRGGLTNLVKPTDTMAAAMDKYKISVTDVNGKVKPLRKTIAELRNKLGGLDKATQANVVSTIFGKEAMSGWLAIINASKGDVDKLTSAIDNSEGATQKMADTMNNNAKGAITEMKSAVAGAGIKLYETFAPAVTRVANTITKLADSFNSLSPGTKKMIMNLGALTLATGGFLKVASVGIKGYGTAKTILGGMAGLMGKATTATAGATAATTANAAATATAVGKTGLLTKGAGLLSKALNPVGLAVAGVGGAIYLYNKNTTAMNDTSLKSREELGLLDKAFTAVNGTVNLSQKEMEKAGIRYKEFGKDVSEETADSLKKCSKRIAEFNLEMQGGFKIKDFINTEDGKKLNQKLDKICDSAIKKIESRTPGMQKKLAEGFKADDGVLDENEKTLNNYFNKSKGTQIKRVKQLRKEILDLRKKYDKQTVEAKKQTAKDINAKTKEIGRIELKNTVKNQKELIAAQANFNTRMKNLDMKGVGKLLAEKAKVRNSETKKIKQSYDERIEYLKLSKDGMNKVEKKAADAEIKQLENKKKAAVKVENDKYKAFLDSAIKKYPELVAFIDTKNGEILSNAEKAKQTELLKYGSKMENMLGLTQSGYYKIKDTTTGAMHDCYVNVDSTTGKITGVWDDSTKRIYGNPVKAKEEIDEALKNGQKFKPIGDSWDKEQLSIYKNPVEIACKENPNIFDWVGNAWRGIRSWISGNPVKPKSTGAGSNWTGTNYWQGGLTYLHDAPGKNLNYELYDLPRGTRIFNHDASADLVKQTAENVATEVANSVLKNFEGLGNTGGQQTIIVPVNLDGREIARITAKPMSEELGRLNKRGRLGYV